MDRNPEDLTALAEDEVTFVDLALFLEQNMKLIGAFILAMLIAALAYVLIKTPIYRVSALLESVAPAEVGAPPGGNLNALAAVAGINLGSAATNPADRSLAVIQSHEFLASFVKDREITPLLFPDDWDPVSKKWKGLDADDVPTIWDGVREFKKDVFSVTADKRTGFVTLTIEWQVREQAVDWVNDLIRRLNARMRKQAMEDVARSLKYLGQELQTAKNVRLGEAIARVMEQQITNLTMAKVREDYAYRVIDPPVAPPVDEYVQPREILILPLSIIVGLMLGIFAAMVRHFLQQFRKQMARRTDR